jgi:hypothetical protein
MNNKRLKISRNMLVKCVCCIGTYFQAPTKVHAFSKSEEIAPLQFCNGKNFVLLINELRPF